MLYYPERVMLLGFCVYALIYLIAPITNTVEIQTVSVIFISLCCLGFVIGSKLANTSRPMTRYHDRSAQWMQRHALVLFFCTFALGALGDVLKAVDTYYLRSSGSVDAMELRDALIDNHAGPLSMVAGVLYPFGYVPLMLYLGSKNIPRKKIILLSSSLLFLEPAIDALALLSRSSLIVAVAMAYFSLSLTLFSGQIFPKRLRGPSILLIAGLGAVSSLIFSVRLDAMRIDTIDSIYASAYGYTVTPNAWAQRTMQNGSGFLAHLLESTLPLFQYYTHSIFEFQILWSKGHSQIHSYGLLHAGAYAKALSMFNLAHEADVFELFPRVGVFTSLFGPLWVDFAWTSPFFMLFFGFMARQLGNASARGDAGAIPLYSFICVIVFLAPVADFLLSKGLYVFNALMLFWLASRRYAHSRTVSAAPARLVPPARSTDAIALPYLAPNR